MRLVFLTDSVILVSANSDLETTRATIAAVAETLQLRVDSISEDRGRLSSRLKVTVTGTGEQIEAFRDTLQGDGWSSGRGGLIDHFVLDPILGTTQRSLSKWWRKRGPRKWGAEPAAVPTPPPDLSGSPPAKRDSSV